MNTSWVNHQCSGSHGFFLPKLEIYMAAVGICGQVAFPNQKPRLHGWFLAKHYTKAFPGPKQVKTLTIGGLQGYNANVALCKVIVLGCHANLQTNIEMP